MRFYCQGRLHNASALIRLAIPGYPFPIYIAPDFSRVYLLRHDPARGIVADIAPRAAILQLYEERPHPELRRVLQSPTTPSHTTAPTPHQ